MCELGREDGRLEKVGVVRLNQPSKLSTDLISAFGTISRPTARHGLPDATPL